jgi:hypothetical protein
VVLGRLVPLGRALSLPDPPAEIPTPEEVFDWLDEEIEARRESALASFEAYCRATSALANQFEAEFGPERAGEWEALRADPREFDETARVLLGAWVLGGGTIEPKASGHLIWFLRLMLGVIAGAAHQWRLVNEEASAVAAEAAGDVLRVLVEHCERGILEGAVVRISR